MGSTGGWNRPASNQLTVKKGGAKAPSAIKGIIVGAIAVAVGVACILMFSGGDDAPKAKPDKEHGRIKAVTPAPAPKAKEPPKIERRTLPDGRYMEYRDGKPLWLFPRQPPTKTVFTNDTAKSDRTFEQKVFKNAADAHIAVLLNTEPGVAMVGEPESYYRNFDKQFKAAILEPIEIDPTDTDEVKALKESVIAAREELKSRMDAGEDVKKVMCDGFRELQELGLYRLELEREINKLAKDGDFSHKDLDDLLGAANKMLEERGAKPLKMTSVLKHKAKMLMLKGKKGK